MLNYDELTFENLNLKYMGSSCDNNNNPIITFTNQNGDIVFQTRQVFSNFVSTFLDNNNNTIGTNNI